MKALEIAFASVMLVLVIWRLAALFRQRREAARAAMTTLPRSAHATGETVSPELAEAGFTEPVAAPGFEGARGVFDGVVIQALVHFESSPYSRMSVITLAVVSASPTRWRVSARPQGMRKDSNALVVGHPKADDYLDITGDPDDARALFARPGIAALVDAIAVWGWRLDDGALVREKLGASQLRAATQAGVAAAKAIAR